MTTFADFKLNKQLLNAIKDVNYVNPTPIQEKVIPLFLNGQDVIGIAQTGTGKTAAFLLPLLMKIKFAQPDGPKALILEPTRELAIQVSEECEKLSKYTDIRHVATFGGLGPKSQIEEIRKGTEIIISTPGRFLEIYLKGEINTKFIRYFIIDEADRMMDMGFMPQVNRILEIVPRKRQNLLFSATMPDKVKKLTENFLEFPHEIEITPQATAAETVEQIAYYVPNHRTKIELLSKLLENNTLNRVLIFTKTKKNADDIYNFITRKIDENCRVIHSNKGQNTRINAINSFKNNEIRILVSTDVSARGIDVENVSHVINFDIPTQYEDYIHRIGRTGRAFKTGVAITFINPSEEFHLNEIVKLSGSKIQFLSIPNDVKQFPTTFEEQQEHARMVDYLKRKLNPDFKGAFHEKSLDKKSQSKSKKTPKNKKK